MSSQTQIHVSRQKSRSSILEKMRGFFRTISSMIEKVFYLLFLVPHFKRHGKAIMLFFLSLICLVGCSATDGLSSLLFYAAFIWGLQCTAFIFWCNATSRIGTTFSVVTVVILTILAVDPLCKLLRELIQEYPRIKQLMVQLEHIVPENQKYSAIPSMLPSLSFILLFRSLLEWTNETPRPSENTLIVQELNAHRLHIGLFVVLYLLYITYWLQGHTRLLTLYALLTIVCLIGDTLLVRNVHSIYWSPRVLSDKNALFVVNCIHCRYLLGHYVCENNVHHNYRHSIDSTYPSYDFCIICAHIIERVSKVTTCCTPLHHKMTISKIVECVNKLSITWHQKSYIMMAIGLGYTPILSPNQSKDDIESYICELEIRKGVLESLYLQDSNLQNCLVCGLICGSILTVSSRSLISSATSENSWRLFLYRALPPSYSDCIIRVHNAYRVTSYVCTLDQASLTVINKLNADFTNQDSDFLYIEDMQLSFLEQRSLNNA